MQKRHRGLTGGWRRRDWKARHVNQGDLSARRDGVHAESSRRAEWTGVRAPIRAKKGHNWPGAKGAQEGGCESFNRSKTDSRKCRKAKPVGELLGTSTERESAMGAKRMLAPQEHGKGKSMAKTFVCVMIAASQSGFIDVVSILNKVKPLTGEPDAGEPPVRFGGRGG